MVLDLCYKTPKLILQVNQAIGRKAEQWIPPAPPCEPPRLLQILNLTRDAGFLIREAGVPLLIVLGEAAIDLVDDESRLQIHDSQAVLSSGEVIVG